MIQQYLDRNNIHIHNEGSIVQTYKAFVAIKFQDSTGLLKFYLPTIYQIRTINLFLKISVFYFLLHISVYKTERKQREKSLHFLTIKTDDLKQTISA